MSAKLGLVVTFLGLSHTPRWMDISKIQSPVGLVAALVAIAIAAACSASPTASPTATPKASPTEALATRLPPTTTPTATARPGSDRPYEVFVPDAYDGSRSVPLLMLLHWYGGSGDIVEAEYKLEPLAQSRHFLYVRPDATPDAGENLSWNATDACCHRYPPVDDTAYLATVIDEVTSEYNVDSKRIYLVGISNGGFMAYRMACDYADRFAAMVSIVGAGVLDPTDCKPSEPVSILEIHGKADEMVPWDGGQFVAGHPFPGTEQTVADWAALNGCEDTRNPTGETLDLESSLDGAETAVSAFGGCPDGVDVELWTVEGGDHTLDITPAFVPAIVDFLLTHAKP